ncbi:MAG: InlB B-repeat-containing protein, partial [Clostridia bacterium]|nr:InlB B-repeat-containing protein [Clostridia bacterium]
LSTPTREGYNFLGWYSGDTKVTESTPITSDMTLTAKWEIKAFKVSFLDYYGNTVSTQTVNYGESATAPTVDSVIEKKRFDGWSADFSKIVEDMTVNALYVDNTYTITYNLGDKGESINEPCFFGDIPKIPAAPVIDGYVFTGWFFDEELTERYFFDYKLDRDITLYAKFYDTTLGEYIVISNLEQVKAIKDQPGAKYLFACDINCKGEKLTPINSFSGELDGNGYKIHNFIISETSTRAGIINTIATTGVIKNLNISDYTYTVTSSYPLSAFYGVIAAINYGLIENCHVWEGEIDITLSYFYDLIEMGGLVGRNGNPYYPGHIENCTNHATINANIISRQGYFANVSIGGISGKMEGTNSQIINCTNYGEVNANTTFDTSGNYVQEALIGGICGWNQNAKIDNSANLAEISCTVEIYGGNKYVYTGGVVAYNRGNINNSYSNGNVTQIEINDYNNNSYRSFAGGFAGLNCGTVYNCYSTGNVSAMPSLELYAGGFVGHNAQQSGYASTITKCFSTGNVEYIDDAENSTSVICIGQFAGKNDVNIRDCYYLDSATLTYKNVAGEVETSEAIEATCTDGTAKTFDELTSVDFIENTLYFDRMIWLVVEGELPTLR